MADRHDRAPIRSNTCPTRIAIAGPQGVQASFDRQAALDPDVARMCTVSLVNARAAC